MRKKVNIIGAGIAGLSVGCYLQMNGYDTGIFELHSHPGGLCTAWKRKDYTIDGCIEGLVGSGPNSRYYKYWKEIIDIDHIPFVHFQVYRRFEDTDGTFLDVFTNVDRLEDELLKKAAEDRELILDFTNAVRQAIKIEAAQQKCNAQISQGDELLKRWSGITAREYAEKCKNPLLKKMFFCLYWPESSVRIIIMMMAWLHGESGGYPIGGSRKFAERIGERYLELGGKIHFLSRVTQIITENNSARGIVLESGGRHPSDFVVSAADGYYTIFKMLQGRYVNEKIRRFYLKQRTFPSYIQVSLGVSRTFENEPHTLFLFLDKPLIIDESIAVENIFVRILNYDKTLAPEGKTVITAMFPTPYYDYWDNLKKDEPEKYRLEKNRIANELISILDKKFGNVRANIEMIDVSTPSTVIRYTNNWRGSLSGWFLTPELESTVMEKTLPGLNNFYMAGQWVEPGGNIPPVFLSGRNAARMICEADGKQFRTKD